VEGLASRELPMSYGLKTEHLLDSLIKNYNSFCILILSHKILLHYFAGDDNFINLTGAAAAE